MFKFGRRSTPEASTRFTTPVQSDEPMFEAGGDQFSERDVRDMARVLAASYQTVCDSTREADTSENLLAFAAADLWSQMAKRDYEQSGAKNLGTIFCVGVMTGYRAAGIGVMGLMEAFTEALGELQGQDDLLAALAKDEPILQ